MFDYLKDIFAIVFPLLILLFIVTIIIGLFGKPVYNIKDFCVDDAILLDYFITYSRSGTPYYYLIYKFNDGSIKDFNVSASEYYKYINIECLI